MPERTASLPASASRPGGLDPGVLALSWADGAALLTVFSWGISFPLTKVLMTLADPLAVAALRAALAALLLVVLLARSRGARVPARQDLGRAVLAGLIGVTMNGSLYNAGLHLTTATHTGLIYTLTPLFVFGLSYLLGQMRVVRRDLLGLALGVVGAALIVGAPALAGGDTGGATLVGDLLIVGAMITFGLWSFLAEPLIRRYGALATTAWVNVVGAIGLLPLGLPALATQDWHVLGPGAAAGLLYIGLVVAGASTLFWYWAVGRIGPARTIIYANLESFFAVLAAAIALGERVELTAILGGVAVIAGVLLTRGRADG